MTMWPAITDWDAVYDNAPAIPNGQAWPALWVEPAAAARAALSAAGRAFLGVRYGAAERERYDLFLPEGAPGGLAVFIHGGFWMALDESYWSHLAAGPLAHGFAVAIPTYTIAPEGRIPAMTRQIGAAITHAAAAAPGPIHLCGHSAGGHLATRMVCRDGPLPPEIAARVGRVVSISGLHDLRPMLRYWRNATLRLSPEDAAAESPALSQPVEGLRLTCWAGAMETSEFLRQNALLANIWRGLGAATECVEEPMRHHFNVVDGLAEADHPLTRALCG